MERKLPQVEAEIESWTSKRQAAIEVIAEANEQLLRLGSERNRIMGRVAARHLHVVPNVAELRPTFTDDVPDGAA